VLIGVSFGGILVQEMSRFLRIRKLIIISSVKSREELPRRMRLAKHTRLYKLLPTRLVNNIDAFTKYEFGKTVSKRLELYKKYLSVNDKVYLDWAIEQLICWRCKKQIPNIIHIHGDKDAVFPIKYISNKIVLEGGTHIMIVNKFKWFNENLPKLIIE
ncbi:MAG: alpha/beta hydrolase, partial [Flavobacteriaceae bacterium]|nr:alpha/beta hydrolase [Flavobacteriaceae bacterium]